MFNSVKVSEKGSEMHNPLLNGSNDVEDGLMTGLQTGQCAGCRKSSHSLVRFLAFIVFLLTIALVASLCLSFHLASKAECHSQKSIGIDLYSDFGPEEAFKNSDSSYWELFYGDLNEREIMLLDVEGDDSFEFPYEDDIQYIYEDEASSTQKAWRIEEFIDEDADLES